MTKPKNNNNIIIMYFDKQHPMAWLALLNTRPQQHPMA